MINIQSMTGFGNEEIEINGWCYRCEIRTLNSRFIEVNIRMPRSLISIEPQLITHIKNTLSRGKVDVFIEVTKSGSTDNLSQLNAKAVEHYVHLLDQLHSQIIQIRPKNFSLETIHTAQEFMALPNVLINDNVQNSSEEFMAEQQKQIFQIVTTSLSKVIESRKTEGAKLKTALEDLINQISTSRQLIANEIPDLRVYLHESYMQRLTKLIAEIEKAGISATLPPQERIVAEISHLIDKADIEEEITRLKAHESEFLKTLNDGQDVGRKLDFLCQEFHREVNTISSKLQPTKISEQTLKMKQAIERIRQQVQNIE